MANLMNHLQGSLCFAVPTASSTTASFSTNVGVGYSSSLLIADSYGNSLLLIGVVIFLAGLVGLWFASRVTPKGTVLAIAAGIYIVSWLINPGQIRELHGLVGLMRLLGFAGGVLGIIDVVKKRKLT